ncbi:MULTISPECIES: hypothetical protein [unclassified Clostridium]|uniref:hypothetical protein n=1 Tax=unclassified Clostridium TaxID=2614128 RepID=UPI00207AA15C|nr:MULTISPECIES: hypothetical protein [unclassified Clostridium]
MNSACLQTLRFNIKCLLTRKGIADIVMEITLRFNIKCLLTKRDIKSIMNIFRLRFNI